MVPRRHDVSGDSAKKNQCKELFALWNAHSSQEKLGDIHNHMVAKSEINLFSVPSMTSWSLHKMVTSIGLYWDDRGRHAVEAYGDKNAKTSERNIYCANCGFKCGRSGLNCIATVQIGSAPEDREVFHVT